MNRPIEAQGFSLFVRLDLINLIRALGVICR